MNSIFSIRLRELRKSKRLTQRQVADLLHVAQTTIANYERGSRMPDLEKLAQIGVLFQVSIDYLLGKELQLLPEKELTIPQPEAYFNSLRNGDKSAARAIILRLIQYGMSTEQIYRQFMEQALVKTGDLWQAGEIAVWQEHLISEIVQINMALLKGARRQEAVQSKRILCLLPGEESHMIGLRMMGDLLEERGHQVHFLGNGLPADNVFEAIAKLKPDFVLLSVTMPGNVSSAKSMIRHIQQQLGVMSPHIIIGGKALEQLEDPRVQLNAYAECQTIEVLFSAIEQ